MLSRYSLISILWNLRGSVQTVMESRKYLEQCQEITNEIKQATFF